MFLEIILAVILPLVISVVYNYLKHIWNLHRYPPGPFPLPIIGNLHHIAKTPYKESKKISETYGSVFSLSFGIERVVFINTIEPAKEAMFKRGDDFANRPRNLSFEVLSRGYKNISMSGYGPFYKTIKKIGHSSLRAFGEGNKKIEKICIRESKSLRDIMLESEEKPVQVNYKFGVSVLNVMSELMFGIVFKHNDEEANNIIDMSNNIVTGISACDVVNIWPWLRFLPLEGYSCLKKGIGMRDVLYRDQYKRHKETFDEENLRDVMDGIIKVLNDDETKEKAGITEITEDHVEMLVNDIYLGGTETTNSTLQWIMIYFIHWPHVLQKCYNEIIKVCGQDRYPEISDRPNLHYFRATLYETLRFSSLAPFLFPRMTVRDTEVGGYQIPKDTQVILNGWAIHHDEKHWKEPELFNPDRFLDEEGHFIPGMNESFMGFGAGKRQCFGEALAKTQLFIILTRWITDFTVKVSPGNPLPSFEGTLGVTLTPKPFKAVFVPRNNKNEV